MKVITLVLGGHFFGIKKQAPAKEEKKVYLFM
jgi:hypothetical protein